MCYVHLPILSNNVNITYYKHALVKILKSLFQAYYLITPAMSLYFSAHLFHHSNFNEQVAYIIYAVYTL